MLDLRAQIRQRDGNGDFFVGIADLRRFEAEHGTIPPGSYVVLYTGLPRFYSLGNARRPGPYNDYFDDVPGFSGVAVDWLFEHRQIPGVGADTFGRTRPSTSTSRPPPRPPARAASRSRTWAKRSAACGPSETGSS